MNKMGHYPTRLSSQWHAHQMFQLYFVLHLPAGRRALRYCHPDRVGTSLSDPAPAALQPQTVPGKLTVIWIVRYIPASCPYRPDSSQLAMK